MIDFVNASIGYATLAAVIALGVLVLLLSLEERVRGFIYPFVRKHILLIIFLESFVALVGSLIYSRVIGFPPCELCWVQRVCMYPLPLLAFIGFRKKETSIVDYILPLALFGGVVALYHSFVQWGMGGSLLACTSGATGECARVYVNELGFITIPFMSLVVFLYIIVTILFYKKAVKVHTAA